ncbi:SAV_2336 N-terminal domain-related protein [Streptomyces sp. NPDC051219]|uniref:SAV_2336 N-terminal domain-related protein n=1 Tax=Streptomyces sp. NPDC051219 TaxID=3155283 RepID=UPI00342DB37C
MAAALLHSEADIGLEEVFDVAWLAGRLTTSPDASLLLPALEPEGGIPRTQLVDGAGAPRGQPKAREAAADGVSVFLPRAEAALAAAGGAFSEAVHAPGATRLLAERLPLGRALRNLPRTSPSPVRTEVDEVHTAEWSAATGLVLPVATPALEPRFDLTLVCDTGGSMSLWEQLMREMATAAAHHGAFRSVTVRRLRSDDEEAALFGPGGDTGFGELVEPNGRRIVAFVTDAVGRGWHDGQLAGQANRLARHGPVVVIHLLPRHLWPRTGVNPLPVYFHPCAEGASGAQAGAGSYRFTPAGWAVSDLWPGGRPPGGGRPHAVPVVPLDPAALSRWASLVAGERGRVVSGSGWIVWEQEADEDRPRPEFPPPTAMGAGRVHPGILLSEFDATATVRARRLVRRLATAPLNLSTMWLVHLATSRWANEPADPAPLAEVFLSGLLRRRPGTGMRTEAAPPGSDDYEFVGNVRQLLLEGMDREEAIATFSTVSAFVTGLLGRSPLAFPALLASPGDTALISQIDTEVRPLAKIAAQILKGLGPAYRDAVQRIENAIQALAQPQTPRGPGGLPPEDGQVAGFGGPAPHTDAPAPAPGAAAPAPAPGAAAPAPAPAPGAAVPAPARPRVHEAAPAAAQENEPPPEPTERRAPRPARTRPGKRVAVLGAAHCGKTTFLAAAWLAAISVPEERGRWNIIARGESDEEFLVQQTRSLTVVRRFPEPTLTPKPFSYVFRAELRGTRTPFRSPERVDFTLDFYDAHGGHFLPRRYGKDPVLDAHLAHSNRILLLVDPFRAPNGDPQASYLAPHLSRLTSEFREHGRLEEGRLPHHVAVCLSKFDHPEVFREARAGNWVGQNEEGDPCVPPEDAERFIAWLARKSPDIKEIQRLVAENFIPERVSWFVLSAIGIHRRKDGSVDLDDCSNQTRDEDGTPMLRGEARPLNVLEPLIALGRARGDG